MVSATSVRQVIEILGSRTITDYKRDLIKCSNLDKKLKEKDFDISKFWSKEPPESFSKYGNDSIIIKK